MNRQLSQQYLEHLFANNFSSSIFTILANTYYNSKQYDRAEKVCQIGLKNNPENQIGQYILAEIMVHHKNFSRSEKLLKTIIKKDQNNIKALLLLWKVSSILKRQPAILQKYYEKLLKTMPDNKTLNKFKKNNQIAIKLQEKKNKTKEPKTQEKQIQINDDMATKTMYVIMQKQKKHTIAKHILEIMINKKRHIAFSKRELKKINSLIDKEKN